MGGLSILAARITRTCQYVLNFPSAFYTRINGAFVKAELLGPFPYTQRFTVKSNQSWLDAHSALVGLKSKRLVQGPTALYPAIDSACVDANSFGPFGNDKGLTVKSDFVVISLVGKLLAPSSPFYINGIVPAVIINSFNRMIRRWPWAEIGIEIREGFHPSFTNSDSSPAIAMVRGMARIQAASPHRYPNMIFRYVFSVPSVIFSWSSHGAIIAHVGGNA